MSVCKKNYFQGIHAVHGFCHVDLIGRGFHIGNVKDSVSTDCNDQNCADQSGNHKGTSLSDKRCVENVFQYQASEIHNCDYKKNVNKSTQKIISYMLQNAVQGNWLFHKEASEQCSGKYNINSYKGNAECHSLEKPVTCAHPAYHPADHIKVDQDVHRCKKYCSHRNLHYL